MTIEHVTDRYNISNSTIDTIGEPRMIDTQRAYVASHIADLQREAAAIRAERDRDHVREQEIAGTDVSDDRADHPAVAEPTRVRVGRWLVAVGEAIAGRTSQLQRATAAGLGTDADACDDCTERSASAA